MPSFLPHNVLDIGELRVVLVVLLVLRAVDCRVVRLFHGWCLCGDSIAKSPDQSSDEANHHITIIPKKKARR